jgi:hypothetical protein
MNDEMVMEGGSGTKCKPQYYNFTFIDNMSKETSQLQFA